MMRLSGLFLSSVLLLSEPIRAQQWRAESAALDLGVNLAQGSLNVQVPLPSLPATDGFAPRTQLGYFATAADSGEGFGPGWSIPTSSIRTTLDHGGMIHASADRLGTSTGDFKYSLELDGQRLVWLNSTAATRISQYTIEHRDSKRTIARHDRPFTVKLYAGTSHERDVTLPAGFRVVEADGVERIYSGDLNVAEGIVTNPDAKYEFSRTFISRWPLVFEIRPGGNTIEYAYEKVSNVSVLKKITFAYERSSYVFQWQERTHGPVSRAMGYIQERLHLYTRIVACYDQKPQHTWVMDYQNGPAAGLEESSCAEAPRPAEPGVFSRLMSLVEGWFTESSSLAQPRLHQIHRFGSRLSEPGLPTLSFQYTDAPEGSVHVKDLVQDGAFRGFGPSGNLEFLDADQDGIIDLLHSSAEGSQILAGKLGTIDPNARSRFLVQNAQGKTSLGFNETIFHQGSVMTADMDGDGWIDIVHIKPKGSWIIYLNDRHGSFQSAAPVGNLQIAPEVIGFGRGALMDIDGDRRADIIYPSLGASGQIEWQVYLNKDSQTFLSRRFSFPFRSINPDILLRNDLRFVDANHDGLVDLVKFSQDAAGNSSLCLFENTGRTAAGDAYLFTGDAAAGEKGCASQVAQTLQGSGDLSKRFNSVWLADINGDSLLDVVDLNDDGRTFSYWLGQIGDTAYSDRLEMNLAEAETLAIDPQNKFNSFPMDVNLDGTDEIVFFEPSTAALKILQFPAVRSGTEAGLLSTIKEEQGVEHWIGYQPAHSFGFKTGASLPYPTTLVRQIITRDQTIGSDSLNAAVMNYQEPIWDATLGVMLGFRRAQLFEPGTRVAEGQAIEDARLVSYQFTDSRALASRWSEKSIVNVPWTAADEQQFSAEAARNDSVTVAWNNPAQAMLWREKQSWRLREFPSNALPEGTAHVLPRQDIVLEALQTECCDARTLACESPQIEQTLYQRDEALRPTQEYFSRTAYRLGDGAPGDALPAQHLIKNWTYEDADATLRIKSYQEFDDAKASTLAYQEDFEYLGKNSLDRPDTSTQTFFGPGLLPESVRSRKILSYDAFGNISKIQDASERELSSSLYDSESGSLLLEQHEAGTPTVRTCYSSRDCTVTELPKGLVLPEQSIVASLRMDSSGAWESRQSDALHRPIATQNSAGFSQTQSYLLKHISTSASSSDQGSRVSNLTLLGDGSQRIRLSAQSGPVANQLWISKWNHYSRRGNLLLSATPFLVSTSDSQETLLRKNLDLIPQNALFTSYDALGRITDQHLSQGRQSLAVQYFPWGRQETTRDDQDQAITQTFVAPINSAPTLIIDPSGARQIFARNVWGGIESVQLADEAKPRLFLSYGGRLPAETYIPGMRRVSSTYDENLLIKERRLRDNTDKLASTLRYSYDDQRRLLQIRNAGNQLLTSYSYKNDFLASATQSDPAQPLQVRRTFERDEQGRVKKEQVLFADQNRQIVHQATESYDYTEDNLLRSRITAAGQTLSYDYAPDQTTRSIRKDEKELFRALAFDAAGHLHQAAYADQNIQGLWDHDPTTMLMQRSQVCPSSLTNCAFDEQRTFADNGQLVNRTRQSFDDMNQENFGYSDRRELLRFDRNGQIETFSYNGFGGRKVSRQPNYDALGRLQNSATIDAISYSDTDKPLRMQKGSESWLLGYDAQGNLSYRMGRDTLFLPFDDLVQNGTETQHTLNLPGTMQALMSPQKATRFQWLDARGAPLVTLDESGMMIERFTHKVFGQRQLPLSSENLLPFDFARQRLDTDTGLIIFRDRWYDPEMGQFISPDARTLEVPELCLMAQWMDCNLYSYRGNNPL